VRGRFDVAQIGERALGLFNERSECCGLVNGQIGENLTVNGNLSPAEAVDKSTIGQAVDTGSGVDALAY
jgi:uncharacterized Ntn-hydrolase superfamily protein